MKLILGSSSKYRKAILEKAGYVFDIISPDVDEKNIKTENTYQRPLILARAKADAVIEKVVEPSIIITSDVIVVCNGKLFEKPESNMEARQFLEEYSKGTPAEVICAIVVVNTVTNKRHEGVESGKVFFKSFSQSMIENFLKVGEPLTRAGGFAIQHPLMKPYVEKIEGSEETIIGMSLNLLQKLLWEAGYKN